MRMTLRNMFAHGCASLILLCAGNTAFAQADSAGSAAAHEGSIPVLELLATVAKNTGKKFVVDSRVQGNVTLIELSPASLSYAQFVTVLQLYGFAAVDGADFVRVVPEAAVRQLPLPVVENKEKRAEGEYVTKVIAVRNVPAAHLVPILRPLLPQQAHLAAAICSNDLLIVDTAANVKRIEALVRSLDHGEGFTPKACAPRNASGT